MHDQRDRGTFLKGTTAKGEVGRESQWKDQPNTDHNQRLNFPQAVISDTKPKKKNSPQYLSLSLTLLVSWLHYREWNIVEPKM